MKFYVHRLSGSQTPLVNDYAALRARNLAGLVREDEPHLVAFIAKAPAPQTLYVFVGENLREHLYKDNDFIALRSTNSMNNLPVGITQRMVSVRNDWSRR